MRATGLLSLVTAAAVAASVALPGVAAECSACRYTAWNCSAQEAIANDEISVQAASGGKSELRKEAVASEQALAVCNAEGKIQVDDVFCTGSDCACVDGKHCVNMLLGCQNIFQARSRKRCIGDTAIQERFRQCAGAQALTTQTKVNLDTDWVYFNQPSLCKSADCGAVHRFHQCGAVQCGRLVVAWKESATQYRFVVDGSRAQDMEAGTFLFSATMDSSDMCSSISNTKIENCYMVQTRNQKNGTCNGIYLQTDTNLLATDDQLSKLDWGLWSFVVGSVAAAFASVVSVIVVVLRHRRERQQEEGNGLLQDDSAELKTPDLDAATLQSASLPPTKDLRQRPLSPRVAHDSN